MHMRKSACAACLHNCSNDEYVSICRNVHSMLFVMNRHFNVVVFFVCHKTIHSSTLLFVPMTRDDECERRYLWVPIVRNGHNSYEVNTESPTKQ